MAKDKSEKLAEVVAEVVKAEPAALPAGVDLKSLLAEAMKEAATFAIAMGKSTSVAPAMKAIDLPDYGAPCGECGQYLRACKGKHKKVVIYPKNRRLARAGFVGFIYNGVRYRSTRPNQLVTVPFNCPVKSDLARWERNEENLTLDTGSMKTSFHLGQPTRGGRANRF